MAISDQRTDAGAIEELHESFAAQKVAFLSDPYPSAGERRERVLAVAAVLIANRQRIRDAMSSDFAVHPELFTDMVEVVGMVGRAAPCGGEPRDVDAAGAALQRPGDVRQRRGPRSARSRRA